MGAGVYIKKDYKSAWFLFKNITSALLLTIANIFIWNYRYNFCVRSFLMLVEHGALDNKTYFDAFSV